jgi:hypothetical protein
MRTSKLVSIKVCMQTLVTPPSDKLDNALNIGLGVVPDQSALLSCTVAHKNRLTTVNHNACCRDAHSSRSCPALLLRSWHAVEITF